MAFNLLIDYDNLSTPDLTRGLIYIVESILSKLSISDVNDKNVKARLYGGWYENNNITRRAQDLKSDLIRDFPRPCLLLDGKTSVIVNAELAMSLAVNPSILLANTYRRGSIPSGLKAYHPIKNGCQRATCPILHVYNFVMSGTCGECHTATVDDIFHRSEQKLVDTMLTSDMILIAQQEKRFCIVSSDDDFWPGILTSITIGGTVYHFHTQSGRSTPNHYSKTVSQNYYMKNI